MNTLVAFIRLIRLPNLIIIFLTQLLLRYCVLMPIFNNGFVAVESALTTTEFLLLCLSTVLIAAGGYIINDYFDVKSDEINRPERIVIDRYITRRSAIIWHLLLNGIGIALGFWLGMKVGKWYLGFIHFAIMAMLWFYSTWFKKRFLIGNLVISLLTALVVWIVFIYETSLAANLQERMPEIYNYLYFFFIGYGVFAFLVTLIRELIKDMEDIKGDKMTHCKTVPIVLGIKNTKNITMGLVVMVMGLLAWYQVQQAIDFKESQNIPFYQVRSIRLIFTFLQIPLIYIIILLLQADKSSDFKRASNAVKFVMVAGVLFLTYYLSSIS